MARGGFRVTVVELVTQVKRAREFRARQLMVAQVHVVVTGEI